MDSQNLPRPLTQREQDVLHLLVGSLRPGHPARAEASTVQVVGRCTCETCPTINFTLSETDFTTREVIHAGHPSGLILLFIDDGHLSCLELAPNDNTPVLEFPPASEIVIHEEN